MKVEKQMYEPEPHADFYDCCFKLVVDREEHPDWDGDYLACGVGATGEGAKKKALDQLRLVRAAIDEVLDKEEYQREKNERFARMYGKLEPVVKTTDSDEWGIYDVCKVCGLSEFRCECTETKLIPEKEDYREAEQLIPNGKELEEIAGKLPQPGEMYNTDPDPDLMV
jgi:hypothetical protein